jgi:hypothetical protein
MNSWTGPESPSAAALLTEPVPDRVFLAREFWPQQPVEPCSNERAGNGATYYDNRSDAKAAILSADLNDESTFPAVAQPLG